MRKAKSTPDGWHTVTPRLVVQDPKLQVRFLRSTFDADGEYSEDSPTQMKIGDSIVMVSSSGARDPHSAFLYVYVDDIDATYQRALQAGAESIEKPRDLPYGDRRAMVRDPCGNDWQIATHERDH